MTTCWASQAADQEAARIDAAEARDAHIATFTQDATDQVLREDGNIHWLLGADESIEPLLLAVLDADKADAFTAIVALRDGLRAAALASKVIAKDIARRAEKLAEASDDDGESVGRLVLRDFGFPSVRGDQ